MSGALRGRSSTCEQRVALVSSSPALTDHRLVYPVASNVPPPPLAQARPRSQKSGQNGGSTPTLCLDKAVHARDTCDSQTGNNIVSDG